jgi:hypothetical protein
MNWTPIEPEIETTITEEAVDRLRWEAAARDDWALVHLTERALLGDLAAWRRCEELLR